MRSHLQAIHWGHHALEFAQKSLGPKHPQCVKIQSAIVASHLELKQFDEAVKQGRLALDMSEHSGDITYLELCSAIYNYGYALKEVERYADSRAYLEHALKISRSHEDKVHSKLIRKTLRTLPKVVDTDGAEVPRLENELVEGEEELDGEVDAGSSNERVANPAHGPRASVRSECTRKYAFSNEVEGDGNRQRRRDRLKNELVDDKEDWITVGVKSFERWLSHI